MALPISTWFWKSRWVVCERSGESDSAEMTNRRVQVMWSSQYLPMALRKVIRFSRLGAAACDVCGLVAGAAEAAVPAHETSAIATIATRPGTNGFLGCMAESFQLSAVQNGRRGDQAGQSPKWRNAAVERSSTT